jgi:antitoxin PrlF
MKAVVSMKGQVTIPKRLRDRLGIRPGERIDFIEEDGKLVGRKEVMVDRVDAVYGIVDLRQPVDALIADMRGGDPPE